jgi:hypothetical protein
MTHFILLFCRIGTEAAESDFNVGRIRVRYVSHDNTTEVEEPRYLKADGQMQPTHALVAFALILTGYRCSQHTL